MKYQKITNTLLILGVIGIIKAEMLYYRENTHLSVDIWFDLVANVLGVVMGICLSFIRGHR